MRMQKHKSVSIHKKSIGRFGSLFEDAKRSRKISSISPFHLQADQSTMLCGSQRLSVKGEIKFLLLELAKSRKVVDEFSDEGNTLPILLVF